MKKAFVLGFIVAFGCIFAAVPLVQKSIAEYVPITTVQPNVMVAEYVPITTPVTSTNA